MPKATRKRAARTSKTKAKPAPRKTKKRTPPKQTTPNAKYRMPRRELARLSEVLKAADPSAEFDLDHDICQKVWPEEIKRGFESMSTPRRRYLACFMLEAEVNNGGFEQFFDNQGPAVAKDALAFLEDRGPAAVARLLQRAIKVFPGGRLPRSRDAILDLTIADTGPDGPKGPMSRKWERISDSFFAGEFGPKMIRARLEYVAEHPAEFFA